MDGMLDGADERCKGKYVPWICGTCNAKDECKPQSCQSEGHYGAKISGRSKNLSYMNGRRDKGSLELR